MAAKRKTQAVKHRHDVQFDGLSPHNGEYWYKCVRCGVSDWVAGYSDPPTFEDKPCKNTPRQTQGDAALEAAGNTLLAAAMAYYQEHKRATGGAAVVWLTDTEGRLVILSRGEYRDVLMANVDKIQRNVTRRFGS